MSILTDRIVGELQGKVAELEERIATLEARTVRPAIASTADILASIPGKLSLPSKDKGKWQKNAI